MDVYWLEQSEGDVAPNDDWLSVVEQAHLNALRVPKRRADWRLGRWTAKRALAAHLRAPGDLSSLANFEIRPAPSGAPEVYSLGRRASVTISLSHRNGTALCAIGASGAQLGCDLELIEPRSEAFVADYFTKEEQALISQLHSTDMPLFLTLLWSAKESTLKALHEGLRLDTRSVIVSLPDAARASEASGLSLPSEGDTDWYPLEVRCTNGQVFHGWWQRAVAFVRTLVGAPFPTTPTVLTLPSLLHGETSLDRG